MAKIKLEINRTLIDGFISIAMSFSIKEFVSGFAVELLDSERMAWLKPFGYEEVKIYYDDELLLTGRIEKIERSQTKNLKIEGRSLPAVMIEASVQLPAQFHDINLLNLIKEVAKPFNLDVVSQVPNLPTYPNLTAGVDSKVFGFVNCCAENDNILLNSSPAGEILLRHYDFTHTHNTFKAGEHGYLDANITFDGSQRFSSLTLIAQSEDKLDLSYTIEDSSIKTYRPLVETAEATDIATLQNIAKRRLALSIANSINLSLKLNGWHKSSQEDRLLRVGDVIQIQDASLNLPELSTFVIESLELSLSSGDQSMNLTLALPNLYSEEPLEGEAPWQ